MSGHFYFEIQADDPSRATNFYKELFGWQVEKQEGVPVEYWSIQTGGILGGLLKRPTEKPPPECGTNAFVNSIEVDNFDAMAERIEELGGEITLPKLQSPGNVGRAIFSILKEIISGCLKWMKLLNKISVNGTQ